MQKIIFIVLLVFSQNLFSQNYTKQDTLLGSNTAYRAWWDVMYYGLIIKPDYKSKMIVGENVIHYKVISDTLPTIMQIDLQEPMRIDSLFVDDVRYTNYKKETNNYLIYLTKQEKNTSHIITINFSGKPKEATNPPWNGGWVWKKDSFGNPWMSVACQGDGASVWYPCKDLQSDEPDRGCSVFIVVPDTLVGIANGTLQKIRVGIPEKGFTTYHWIVNNPINNYNIVPYIGKYVLLHDSIEGEKGKLITDYWVLNYNKQKAIEHLKPNVIKTLKCLEYWFGAYPFYEDSYKIVEAPYLGMEHQSNIAYGNSYINGYLGSDLSHTGWGLKWDFIVVHETAHEWFGNSVTAKDIADNWIHEGFASYAEALFTECEFGKNAGNEYCIGTQKGILNDTPVIGKYDVKSEGSGDIYNKGSQIINMIRQMVNDDEKFRLLLRNISTTFYHKTVSTKEFEAFISLKIGRDLIPFFNQYLRSIQIPKFEYKIKNKTLFYRYTNCNPDFSMPLNLILDNETTLNPTVQWQKIKLIKSIKRIEIKKQYLIL